MGDAFDPYYIWLGIPPDDQPPNHYRLLGVTLFEANREVIEAAANRQMAYMQEISAGDEHIDEAQKILGELSKARVCLLNSEKKTAYDADLRASFDSLDHASESTDKPPAESAAPATPSSAPQKVADDGPLMPPQFGKTAGQEAPVTDVPQVGKTAKQPQKGSKTKKKKSNSIFTIVCSVAVLFVLCAFATILFVNSQNAKKEKTRAAEFANREKDRKEREDIQKQLEIAKKKAANADRKLKNKEKAERQARQKLKEEPERKAKKEPDRKAKEEAERKAKEEAERKAKEEAERKAKEEAERKAKEEAERKAKEEAERKAKEEAERKAKEEAERKAKEKAEQAAEQIRNNPAKLLESKGFKKKGGKWVFVKEETLKKYSKELLAAWKNLKKLPQGDEAAVRSKLQKYNELLLLTLQVDAMRIAVSDDLTEALNDNAVAEALVKENVEEKELLQIRNDLEKHYRKLNQAASKASPIIEPFAALIINEKEGVVVKINPKLLSEKDGPNLFFLPRYVQSKANLHITDQGQKWMNNNYRAAMLDSNVQKLRIGPKAAQNFPVNFHPTPAEGGYGNGENTYGGQVGVEAWKNFRSNLQSAKVSPNPSAVAEARKNLEVIADKLKQQEQNR